VGVARATIISIETGLLSLQDCDLSEKRERKRGRSYFLVSMEMMVARATPKRRRVLLDAYPLSLKQSKPGLI